MLKQEYIAAGYRVGGNVDQTEIDRAERIVKYAYILPYFIAPPSYDSGTARDALMQLTFIFICQNSATATRAGGVTKNNNTASTNEIDLTLHFKTANMMLEKLKANATSEGVIDDICGIYYQRKIRY